MPFYLFTLFFYLLFLDNNKRKYCTIYLYLTAMVHRLSIYQEKKNTEKK